MLDQRTPWRGLRSNAACLSYLHKASLAVRVDPAARYEMIAADPDAYFLEDHYVNYPRILVGMLRMHPDAMRCLLASAWRLVAKKRKRAGKDNVHA